MSQLSLLILMGIANWLVTTVLVDGEIFAEVRDRVKRQKHRGWICAKAAYLVGCHLCTGTWIGLLMALFVPAVVDVPVAGTVLTGLVIKGIGHLVLLLVNMGNAWIAGVNHDNGTGPGGEL